MCQPDKHDVYNSLFNDVPKYGESDFGAVILRNGIGQNDVMSFFRA